MTAAQYDKAHKNTCAGESPADNQTAGKGKAVFAAFWHGLCDDKPAQTAKQDTTHACRRQIQKSVRHSFL